MMEDGRLENFIESRLENHVTVRTCEKCLRRNVNPFVLDREDSVEEEIWRCKHCGAENVGDMDQRALEEVR